MHKLWEIIIPMSLEEKERNIFELQTMKQDHNKINEYSNHVLKTNSI